MNISIERLLELVKKRYLKKEVLTETEQRELAEAIFYISTGYRFDIRPINLPEDTKPYYIKDYNKNE